MRQGDHVRPLTVAAIVQRAVSVCDPEGLDETLADFLVHYEDRDEPATAIEGRDREFFETAGRLEGQMPHPDLRMAAAVATYLAFRRDEIVDDDRDLLRLAARAEYGDDPPPEIEEWMRSAGVAR